MVEISLLVPKKGWEDLKLLAIMNDICPDDVISAALTLLQKMLQHQLKDGVILLADQVNDGQGREITITRKRMVISGSRPRPHPKKD